MKTCFVVHNAEVARALRSNVGPDARVISPYQRLNSYAIERLIVVDAAPLTWAPDANGEWPRYEDWFAEVLLCRLASADAQLVNVSQRFHSSG